MEQHQAAWGCVSAARHADGNEMLPIWVECGILAVSLAGIRDALDGARVHRNQDYLATKIDRPRRRDKQPTGVERYARDAYVCCLSRIGREQAGHAVGT